MISFNQFRFLSQEAQARCLWEEGVSLDLIRHTENMMVELYSLHQFYVEIFFDKETEEPLFLNSFNHPNGLDAYFSNSPATHVAVNNDGLIS